MLEDFEVGNIEVSSFKLTLEEVQSIVYILVGASEFTFSPTFDGSVDCI